MALKKIIGQMNSNPPYKGYIIPFTTIVGVHLVYNSIVEIFHQNQTI